MNAETANHAMFQASKVLMLHSLEKGAYAAVLRAFFAQSNALSWGKEELITELRKELRVSDVEHRQILAVVNSDKSIKLLRERAKHSEAQVAGEVNHKSYDVINVGPRKKLKAGSTSALAPVPERTTPPAHAQLNIRAPSNLLIDKKVLGCGGPFGPRPCMNVFPAPVPPVFQQIRYYAPAPPLPLHLPPAPTMVPVPRAFKSINKQNLSKKYPISDAIHIRPTDKLIEQIEKACSNNKPDPVLVQNAKRLLKDHERELVDAISQLGDVSDSVEESRKKGLKKGHGYKLCHSSTKY